MLLVAMCAIATVTPPLSAMNAGQVTQLSQAVEAAAHKLRTSIGDQTEVIHVLERFWLLQDLLKRLVYALEEAPYEELKPCRKIIGTVLTSLQSQQARKRCGSPAVRSACENINELLMQLEWRTAS